MARDLLRGFEMLLLGNSLQRQSGSLVHCHNDEFLNKRHAKHNCDAAVQEVEILVLSEGAEDGVDQANEDEWQRNDDRHEDSFLSFLSVGYVEGHEDGKGDNGDVGDYEEGRAGFVQVRRRIALKTGRNVGIRSIDTAYNSKDKANNDDQVDEVEHARVQHSAFRSVDGIEKTGKKSNGCQHER